MATIRIDQAARTLIIDQYQQVQRLDVFDLQGRMMLTAGALTRSTIGLAGLRSGIYIFQFHMERGPAVKRFYLSDVYRDAFYYHSLTIIFGTR